MPNLGPTELIIILVIVLIIFGSSRLPGLFRALGQGVREFRDASKDSTAPTDTPADEKPKEKAEDTKQG
jgi:sec-independent protein translocase protein TatA